MRKVVIFAILPLLLAFWTMPVHASIPSLPHAFYGSVTINGDAAPNDTQVSATVDNGTVTPTQNPVTTVGGSYGINSPKLLVQGDSLSGDVTFYVNGIVMEGATATFEVGGGPTEMKLDLVITDKSITGKVKETVSAGQTDYVIDASDIADTTITVDTVAEVTITVKKYYSNPYPEVTLPAEMLPRYIDVEVDNFDAIVWPMYVEQTYTDAEVAGLDESSLGMYYFKAGAWHKCSDTGVNTVSNYVWANMIRDELSGSPIAIGGTVPPAPPPEGDGVGAPPAIYVETNLFGITASFRISSAGEILKTIEATSEDGMLTITVPKGTIALDKDGKRLKSLQAAIDESPPDLPEDAYIIGLAYNFGPDGATFDPAITLTWSYDPEALPEGVAEEDLVLAHYDEEAGKWVEIECVVDTENNVITASVSHFTTFAIIGAITPPLPPVPAVFSLSNLRIEPAEVEIGEAITITVSVANTGGTKGSYEVVLKINEVVVEKKTVTVAAGSSEIIPFSVTREEAGSYSVTVDGLSASFTVIAPAPLPPEEEEEKVVLPEEEEIVPPAPAPTKPNWPLIGGIIGGCVLVGLLVFFLVRRRAY